VTYEVGQRIWRWSRGYASDQRPAVIVKVHMISGEVTAVSSKSRADADTEKAQVHRMTKCSGLSGARMMSTLEAERAADLEEWIRFRYLSPVTSGRLIVTGWALSAMARYATELSVEALAVLRMEADAAERLLRREQARTDGGGP
jgi:hypothetical protein